MQMNLDLVPVQAKTWAVVLMPQGGK